MSSLLTAGGLLVALLIVVYLLRTVSLKQGRAEGKKIAADANNEQINEQNEKTAEENKQIVEEVEKTHEIHDRLDADPAYRERVRDRFTRPD